VKIRVLQNFNVYEAGQVFDDWPGGMCEILIGRGLIEEVSSPAVETADEQHSVEKAEASPRLSRKKVK
jgi:hypothetical protein